MGISSLSVKPKALAAVLLVALLVVPFRSLSAQEGEFPAAENPGTDTEGEPATENQTEPSPATEGEEETPASPEDTKAQEPDDLSAENTAATSDGQEPYTLNREPVNKLPLAQTDANTGALLLTFPIMVPPGRKGMEPKLALQYSSDSRNASSILGAGWSLNIPIIERINRTGVENLYSNNLFNSSLSGELRTVSLSDGSHGIYGSLDEPGDFLQYEYTADGSWLVSQKEGITYKFGANQSARMADPADPARVFRWYLEEIRDPDGNFIAYEYTKDKEQVYPQKITYGGSGLAGEGIFEVIFIAAPRGDARIMYNAGFRVETARLITQIETKALGTLVRRYRLDYTGSTPTAPAFLSAITESARDSEGNVTTLPPTVFEYSLPFESGVTDWKNESASYVTPVLTEDVRVIRDTGARVADVNGDGYDDLINGASFAMPDNRLGIYLNKTDGTGWEFAEHIKFTATAFTASGGADTGTRLGDFNGDWLVDIADDTGQVFLNENGRGWARPAIYGVAFGIDRNALAYADVNGDGLLDAIYSEGTQDKANGVYLNRGLEAGLVKDQSIVIPEPFTDNYGNSRNVVVLDVNGDGLADMTRHGQCSIVDEEGHNLCESMYINTGRNGWTPTWDYKTPLDTIASLWMPDMNADGMADMVGINNTNSYYNTGVRGWDRFHYPPMQVTSDTRFADINGDGLSDLIRENQQTHKVYTAVGNRPGLLKKVTLSQGGSQEITYKPSTQYKDAGGRLLNPKLPRVLYTAHTITTNDGFGNLTTDTYEYEGGEYYYANPFDRKFAGFHQVAKTDHEGNVTKTFYHQGNETDVTLGETSDHRAKIGRPFRVEIYDRSGKLAQAIVNKWELRDQGGERNFVILEQTAELTFDGGAIHKDKAETFVYDELTGNLLQKTEMGEVAAALDGSFSDIGNDKKITDFSYARGGESGFQFALSQEVMADGLGAKIKENQYFYDNLPHGQLDKAHLTKTENWVAGDEYISSRKAYNSYGLVVSEINPRGKVALYTYDYFNLYRLSVTNPLNQTVFFEYDYPSGQVKKTTDPNGSVVENTYDGFGRVVRVRQTDLENPAVLAPKTEFAYTDTPLAVSVRQTDYLNDSLAAETYTYYDGLNRLIQSRKAAEDGNFMVKDFTYDSRGNMIKESLPYFGAGSGRTGPTADSALYISYEYDGLDRVLAITNAVGTTVYAYDAWQTTVTNPNNVPKDLFYDGYGQLIETDEHEGAQTHKTLYQYDGLGNLTKIADAQGNVRNFHYDGLGRRTRAEDLHTADDLSFGVQTFVFDENSNLTSKTDAKGQIVNYTYDDLDRVMSEDFTGQAGLELIYAYDTCRNGIGRLCAVTATNTATNYEYNPLGGIASETKTLDSIAYHSDFAYDPQGNLTLLTNPDGSQVKYAYNLAGLTEKVEYKSKDEPAFTEILSNIDYAPTGQAASLRYGNSMVTVNTYDEAKVYRLVSKITASGGKRIQDLTYTYDRAGNITKIVDNSETKSKKVADYTYDDLDRLTAAAVTDSATGQNYVQTYTYDGLGNLLGKTTDGVAVTYEYNGYLSGNYANPHAATKIGNQVLTYDANGNLTAAGDNTLYGWDYNNYLAQATSTTASVQFAYDHTGQRVKQTNAQTSTIYPSKYYNLLASVSAPARPSAVTKHIFLGDLLLATVSAPTGFTAQSNSVCSPPSSGDWLVSQNCTVSGTVIAPASVIVSAGATLTLAPQAKLLIDLKRFKLLVKKGGGVLIKKTAALRQVKQEDIRPSFFFHLADHLGSVTVSADAQGAVRELTDYLPFGEITLTEKSGSFGEQRKFIGQEYDPDLGLSYLNARYYNGTIARFLSQDPVFVEIGGDLRRFNKELMELLSDPQEVNAYSYARNNPLNNTDPTGEASVWAWVSHPIRTAREVAIWKTVSAGAGIAKRPFSRALLSHSTGFNPGDITITEQNQKHYGNAINQIKETQQYKDLLSQAISNAQDGEFSTTMSFKFDNGDLSTALHLADANVKISDGGVHWVADISVHDLYDFAPANYKHSLSTVNQLGYQAYRSQEKGVLSNYNVNINFTVDVKKNGEKE